MTTLKEIIEKQLGEEIFPISKEQQSETVKYASIAWVEDPSEKLQLLAIEENLDDLFYIKQPTLNVLLRAIDLSSDSDSDYEQEAILRLVDTEKLSEEIKIELIKKYPNAIQYIRNTSSELQMLAIRTSGYSLETIPACEYKDILSYEQEILDNLMIKDIIE
jgi:hypothetical protein